MSLEDALRAHVRPGSIAGDEQVAARLVAKASAGDYQAYGSRRAAARALGVDEKTLRRWEAGTARPSTRSLGRVREAVTAAREQANDRRTQRNNITLRGVDGRGNVRKVKADKLKLAPGTMARVAADIESGGTGKASFVNGIGDTWYAQWVARSDADDADSMTLYVSGIT